MEDLQQVLDFQFCFAMDEFVQQAFGWTEGVSKLYYSLSQDFLYHDPYHHVTFIENGRVKPHGKEWKRNFQHLMLPFLQPSIFPNYMLTPLANYLKNPKASTDSDTKLSLALKENIAEEGKNFIFELPINSTFIFKGKLYEKGKKRKTRYECIHLKTNRVYLFNQNAEVILMKK